jgi:hypothetical protein
MYDMNHDRSSLISAPAARRRGHVRRAVGLAVAAGAIVLAGWAPAAPGTPRAGPSPAGKALRYEPARVQLVGRLRRQVFAGPPNYRSVEHGDRPEPGWVLHLERPVSVVAVPGDAFNQTERGVRQMQLVLTAEQLRKYARLAGRRVRASGTLFHAHTGHHHTPVLLAVMDLRPHESAKRPAATRRRR